LTESFIIWVIVWCLTPLSTIFQLYRGGHFHWWRKLEYSEKTPDQSQVTEKPLSHNVLINTLFRICWVIVIKGSFYSENDLTKPKWMMLKCYIPYHETQYYKALVTCGLYYHFVFLTHCFYLTKISKSMLHILMLHYIWYTRIITTKHDTFHVNINIDF
jgi:hypothetical protein